MRVVTSLLGLITIVKTDVVVELRKTLRPFRIYEDEPARFGDSIPEDGLLGFLMTADPIHACKPIKPPPQVPDDRPDLESFRWIALIRRSNSNLREEECTFQEKVKYAMDANYSAAIIFNYKDDELIPMGGDNDDIIPSVFVGHSDGEKLRSHYTYNSEGGKYVVRMTDNAPFDINAYLLPFAIVVGICFVIMLGIMIFKCIQDRRRERRHRLPKSSLKKIPTKKFVAGMESQYETCCICLDDYEPGDKLRILPCDHAYHVKCIDPWLLKNKRVCPQCRKKVFASGEVPPSDSESETEDERAPLLARPRSVGFPSGTFQLQNENPFRRAARRLASSSSTRGTETTDSGGESSDDDDDHHMRNPIMGNQLLAEVQIEQPRIMRVDSPTFHRSVEGQEEMDRVYNITEEGDTTEGEEGSTDLENPIV